MKEDGLDIDNLANKLKLQRQISDAILENHENAEQEYKHNRRRYSQDRNAVDRYDMQKHPIKKKYREFNSEATRIFLQ